MFELIAANWLVFLIATLIGVGTAWWIWAHNRIQADSQLPKIAPSAPKSVADLAREMPAATEPVTLMSAKRVAPKAKVAAKAKVKPASKPKADPVPKAKAAPAKKASAPKAKAEAPKTKAAQVAKTKAAVPVKVKKAEPAPKPKADAKPKTAVAAKPKAAAKPKTVPKPKAAPKSVIPDNLELLKGVGPKLNALLKTLGITSFEQVANWSAADVGEIDARLGTFAGRISRDNWVDQAKLLVAGDIKGFEKKYGALGSEIQKG